MDIHPIRNDQDHASALAQMQALWNAPEGSTEYDRLDLLATLVDAYEKTRWPIHVTDPVDAIKAAMSFDGRTQEDLADLLGPNRASEVLRRKRHLTLPMIRKLAAVWHIPPERLIGDYELRVG
ncbi:MAG: transcriptional regulator [Nevskiaceae bacterium]|jgi:HTH-type transcriptional regulator/antitoxin HigA|nr:transcriptional regulator [Nevskiaceae bacterium]